MDFAVSAVVFLVLGIASVALMAQTVPRAERSWLVRVLVAALLMRMLFATMFAAFPDTRVFHEDAAGYEHLGLQLAAQWGGHAPPDPFLAHLEQNYGYTYLCGAIYYVVGTARVSPSYLNCILGTAVVFAIYRLTRRFFIVPVAKRAAILCAFVPSMVLWSAMALKDTPVTFLIVISLWSCIQLKERATIWAFLGVVLPIAAIQPLRFYMIYFVGFAVVASLVFERGSKALAGLPKQIIIVGAAIGMLTFVGVMGAAEQGTSVMSFEHVSTFRQGMSVSAQSGFAEVDISTPGKALAFMPLGVTLLLFSPFPWQFTSVRAALAAPEMFIWWALVPALIRGLRFAIRRRLAETSPMLLFSLVLTLAYSLVHGNIGSGFRQRAQILVFLFIFTSVGVFLKRARDAGLADDFVLTGDQSHPTTSADKEAEAA